MRIFIQSLVLAGSFAFVFLWQQTVLVEYTVPLLGLFIFIYLALSARNKSFNPVDEKSSWISVFSLTSVILLLVFATGGFGSTMFFLLYFIAFGLAFIFEPVTVFVFLLGTVLVFLPDALENDITRNFLMLGSLVLLTPLAFFFGKQFQKEEQEQEKMEAMQERTKDAADTIAKDVESVLEEKTLEPEKVEKLNEVLEETESLRQETKE